ncbi:MAG: fibronectin type III domain-containing protein [Deltaproteobacteria bacterium]|nr:fibronectin type III domain-containing protein [Deltaproteobacteria bacterium]
MMIKRNSLANHIYFHRSILFPILVLLYFLAVILLIPFSKGHGAQVTLTWDPNNEPDLAGYEIYYGTASGNYQFNVDVGNVNTHTVNSLNTGVTYYFAATAYNTSGLESSYSNEVVYSVPACTYSISPSSASFPASGGSGSVLVTTQAGCNWGTSAPPSWVTVNSGSGTGNGTMGYTVSANTGAARMASLTIAGNVYTITEAGQNAYTITASAGTGGGISPSGAVSVQSGASQTFIITPNSGYRVSGVTVDGASVGAVTTYTFTNVTANHTIAATFTTAATTITATAGSNGSITPSGSVSVNSGANQTFTITPNSGYRVSGVTVDGASVGAVTTYTFTNVTANHSIAATFSAISGYPIVSTGSATLVYWSSSATLNGTVNPNGLATTYVFQWGRTTSYGNDTAVTSVGSGTINNAASAKISGLRSYTVYHYRLVATNSAGTTYGADKNFKTKFTGLRK